MNKMLATDLDGTLFYPKKPRRMFSKKTARLIDDFVNEDNKFVVVSARNLESCIKVFDKTNTIPYIVGCNGAYVYAGDKKIFEKTMEGSVLHEIISYVDEKYHPIGYYVMTSDDKFILRNPFKTLFYRAGQKLYDLFQGILLDEYITNETLFLEGINQNKTYKMMILFGITNRAKKKAKNANKDLFEKFGDRVEASWAEQMIEISPHGCTKSTGIKIIKDYLKIEDHNTYVVGDSGNDIAMFKEFYENSFCMKHSPKSIQKYAKNVIKNVAGIRDYILKPDNE